VANNTVTRKAVALSERVPILRSVTGAAFGGLKDVANNKFGGSEGFVKTRKAGADALVQRSKDLEKGISIGAAEDKSIKDTFVRGLEAQAQAKKKLGAFVGGVAGGIGLGGVGGVVGGALGGALLGRKDVEAAQAVKDIKEGPQNDRKKKQAQREAAQKKLDDLADKSAPEGLKLQTEIDVLNVELAKLDDTIGKQTAATKDETKAEVKEAKDSRPRMIQLAAALNKTREAWNNAPSMRANAARLGTWAKSVTVDKASAAVGQVKREVGEVATFAKNPGNYVESVDRESKIEADISRETAEVEELSKKRPSTKSGELSPEEIAEREAIDDEIERKRADIEQARKELERLRTVAGARGEAPSTGGPVGGTTGGATAGGATTGTGGTTA
jgi:hypothetical protein